MSPFILISFTPVSHLAQAIAIGTLLVAKFFIPSPDLYKGKFKKKVGRQTVKDQSVREINTDDSGKVILAFWFTEAQDRTLSPERQTQRSSRILHWACASNFRK